MLNSTLALSLVVPTHRRADQLENLLRSLNQQDFPKDQYEILVVSNFTDPETRRVTELFKNDLPLLRYFELGQRGVNASRNYGLELAASELVYFLDDDCELEVAHHLKTIVELHRNFPDATAIGGGYLLPPGSSIAAQAYHQVSWQWMSPSISKWTESWRLVGGNVSYKKARLDAAGIRFDPEIIFGGAETEMHLRLEADRHQGVLHPEIFLRHRCEVSLKNLISKGLRQGRTAGRFSSASLFSSKVLATKRSETAASETFFRLWLIAFYHFLYRTAFDWGFDFGSTAGLLELGRARIRRISIKTLKVRHFLYRCMGYARSIISRPAWATYNFFRWQITGFLWWRVAEPGLGLIRLFYRLSPEPVHGGRGSLRLTGKFILFCFRKLDLRGSKTSSFMHREWRSKVTHDETSGIFIPLPQSKAEILSLAAISRRFNFRKLVFKEDFFKRGDALEISQELKTNGFEIVIFYQDRGLEIEFHDTVSGLRGLGCRLIPSLTNETSATSTTVLNESHELAIGPDTDLEALIKLVEVQSRPSQRSKSPNLIYVDFFSDHTFSAEKTYALTHELLIHPALNSLTWKTLDLFQPFGMHPASPQRLLEGTIVSKSGDDSGVKWSIIIPCYENFNYLLPVLNHVFRQDYKHSEMEVVLVDDGSRSHVGDYLKSYLEKSPPSCAFKIVRLERKYSGTSNFDSTFRAGLARNAGLLHSRGERLLFIDSDILISRTHLKDLDQAFKSADVIQNVRRMLTKASCIEAQDLDIRTINLQKDTYAEDYYWESFKKTADWNQLSAPWKYVCTYSLAFKRGAVEQTTLFRPEFCEYGFEDTELGFRFFKAGLRFHLLKSPVFHLYPIEAPGENQDGHNSWSVHFDERRRFQTIRRTAELFYRIHRDPSIFFELRSLLTLFKDSGTL
jgi:glycosyltransferase involved in cell wall biosynthesis